MGRNKIKHVISKNKYVTIQKTQGRGNEQAIQSSIASNGCIFMCMGGFEENILTFFVRFAAETTSEFLVVVGWWTESPNPSDPNRRKKGYQGAVSKSFC